ncbi:MAG: hypothetical protein IKK58_00375 [Clostridia bacterium]|nr:hypothetical protein [Clostridia bacterium]
MSTKKVSRAFKAFKALIAAVYPKYELEGVENIPQEPCIIVGNHSQLHGPIVSQLYMPVKCQTWCMGSMMNLKEVPDYAFEDFWSGKPKRSHWFYKILAHLIAPVSVFIFNNADTIGVYHDTRIISTLKQTVKVLSEGESVVIFPEYHKEYNGILYDFRENFVEVARLYHKKTGKNLSFVPMYICPELKMLCFGNKITFDPNLYDKEKKEEMRVYLMEEITRLARELDEHTVIPYDNIPKKKYPKNK